MLKRKIFLDGGRYASCEVDSYREGVDVYLFGSAVNLEEVAKAMQDNGFNVTDVSEETMAICTNRKLFDFQGTRYFLNQCSDLVEWFGESQVGDFTYYYDKVVFHASECLFYAAYIEDTTNYMKI